MTDALNELYPCREELPSDWQPAFDELVGTGHSPRVVCATIDYLREPPTTQRDAAERWDVAALSIRNTQAAVLAHGPLDAPPGTAFGDQRGRCINDYATALADARDWTAGDHYTERGGRQWLLRAGWVDIHGALVGGRANAVVASLCAEIAATLDWEEGVGYVIKGTDAKLYRAGWRALHDALADGEPTRPLQGTIDEARTDGGGER